MRCPVCGCILPQQDKNSRCPDCGTRMTDKPRQKPMPKRQTGDTLVVAVPVAIAIGLSLTPLTHLAMIALISAMFGWFSSGKNRWKYAGECVVYRYPDERDKGLLERMTAKEHAAQLMRSSGLMVLVSLAVFVGAFLGEKYIYDSGSVAAVAMILGLFNLIVLAVGLVRWILAASHLRSHNVHITEKTVQRPEISVIWVIIGAIWVLMSIITLFVMVPRMIDYVNGGKDRVVEVEAVITRITVERDDEGDVDHDVYVEYTFNGKTYQDVEISGYDSDMREGSAVTIEIDPQYPDEEFHSPIAGTISMLVALVLGALLLWFTLVKPWVAYYRKKREKDELC